MTDRKMTPSTFRVIGRPVADRSQPIEANDSLAFPCRMPNGAVIFPGETACNYKGVVGVPSGVLIDAGFKIYEQWLCEVRDHRLVRAVARVMGPASALEEKPSNP